MHSASHDHSIRYRPDIDGLRGIAILLVVIFHAFPDFLQGGFIGVDIFFVISGFLISSIIINDLNKDNFTFYDFYARRIRRIFPALITVLIASCTFGWLVLLAEEYKQLGRHITSGATFISNFILWGEADYFDDDSSLKPLQHLWSLAVEEQFYLCWPLLLWLTWKTRLNALLTIVMVTAISFSLNIYEVHINKTIAFYLPQNRLWELLVGAIICQYKPTFPTANSQYKLLKTIFFEITPIIGIILITYGVLYITKKSLFPGWYALLPTIGAALIILSGPQSWFNKYILSNKSLIFVGIISFPLYLWHWPILSFAHILDSGTPAPYIQLLSLLLAFALSIATYLYIEKPIRLSSARKCFIPLLFSMLTVALAGHFIVINEGLKFRDPTNKNEYIAQKDEQWFTQECSLNLTKIDKKHCAGIPSGKKIVLILGDSHVRHYYEILRKNIAEKGFDPIAISVGGCPFLIDINTSNVSNCAEKNTEILSYLNTNRSNIEALYLAGEFSTYTEKNWLKTANGENINFLAALSKTIDIIGDLKIVILEQIPPIPFEPKKCINRPFKLSSSQFNCSTNRHEMENSLMESRQAILTVRNSHPNVSTLNIDNTLCNKEICSAKDGNVLLYFNATHLNANGVNFVKKHMDLNNSIY